MRHTLTTRRVLVRGDGSTAHEGMFDLKTGEFLKQSTHQGYRGDSCWSRGLAWSLYGFGTCYGYTRDARFLQTAEACADFYIQHTPADGVPPWDFDAPGRRAASRWTLRRRRSRRPACSGSAGCARDPLKGLLYDRTARHIRGHAVPQLSRRSPTRTGKGF